MSQLVFVHGPGTVGCAAGSVRFYKPTFLSGFIPRGGGAKGRRHSARLRTGRLKYLLTYSVSLDEISYAEYFFSK